MNAQTRHALWTDADAVKAAGGHVTGPWRAFGVSIDTRTLQNGDLFVALKGPQFDGHAFVETAFANGAAAAMVSVVPETQNPQQPMLVVADTMEALGALARTARERTAARIIAVTGSVGKTGTKEALRLALATQGRVAANAGNLNNHWGLPLSLARMAPQTDFGIFEMGMNHPGEIAPLAQLARPHVAVITTIEGAHRGNFDSMDAIADAKAEIFSGLQADGCAVLNKDNGYFEYLVAAAKSAGVNRIVSFGVDKDADVRAVRVQADALGADIDAEVMGKAISYRIGAPGAHWVSNSLAVLAAVSAIGGDVGSAADALAEMQPPAGRGRRHTVSLDHGDAILIDDSYNASPASMRAAFSVLAATPIGAGGRRIAVLGDMLELGDQSVDEHAALAGALVDANVDAVFVAGEAMDHLWQALPSEMRAAQSATSEILAGRIRAALHPGDVVLVKGSAGARMGSVVRALLNGMPEKEHKNNAL